MDEESSCTRRDDMEGVDECNAKDKASSSCRSFGSTLSICVGSTEESFSMDPVVGTVNDCPVGVIGRINIRGDRAGEEDRVVGVDLVDVRDVRGDDVDRDAVIA